MCVTKMSPIRKRICPQWNRYVSALSLLRITLTKTLMYMDISEKLIKLTSAVDRIANKICI